MENNKPDELFDDMYEAIRYCLSSDDATDGNGRIYNFRIKEMVTESLKKDARELSAIINTSGFLPLWNSGGNCFAIIGDSLYNLAFTIAVKRECGEIRYDYDAKEIIRCYNDELKKNEIDRDFAESVDKLLDDIAKNGSLLEKRAAEDAKKYDKLTKIAGVVALVIAVIVYFKVSLIWAIVAFFVFGNVITLVARLKLMKATKYVIKGFFG